MEPTAALVGLLLFAIITAIWVIIIHLLIRHGVARGVELAESRLKNTNKMLQSFAAVTHAIARTNQLLEYIAERERERV